MIPLSRIFRSRLAWAGEESLSSDGVHSPGAHQHRRARLGGWAHGQHQDQERSCPGHCDFLGMKVLHPSSLTSEGGQRRGIATPGPHLPRRGLCLLKAHHKMPLDGTLLQQFSPAIPTRSREIPRKQPSKTSQGYWGCPLHRCSQSCCRYLDPGALVIVAGGPGVDNAMVVEAGELRSPALEAKEAVVDRGC